LIEKLEKQQLLEKGKTIERQLEKRKQRKNIGNPAECKTKFILAHIGYGHI